MSRLKIKLSSGLFVWSLTVAVSCGQLPTELLAPLAKLKGICSVPDCGAGDVALQVARRTPLLVHAFDADRGQVSAALAMREQSPDCQNRVIFERIGHTPLIRLKDDTRFDGGSAIRSRRTT